MKKEKQPIIFLEWLQKNYPEINIDKWLLSHININAGKKKIIKKAFEGYIFKGKNDIQHKVLEFANLFIWGESNLGLNTHKLATINNKWVDFAYDNRKKTFQYSRYIIDSKTCMRKNYTKEIQFE